ncbi:hypothetical protein DTO169E5_6140 [Paecilomyces variotii]|nr:hypothetical protein DTO169E5_6140 [Paecilomyces variotii]
MSDFDDADLVARLQSLNTELSKTPPNPTNIFSTRSFLASDAPAKVKQIDETTIKETGLTAGIIETKTFSPEAGLEEQAEQKLSQFKPSSRTDDTVLILKSFLDHLPRDQGRWVLVRYIAGSEDAGALRSLADYLYTTLLAPFKACGAKALLVEPSPLSREGIRPDDDFEKRCSERDEYRCMLTRLPDVEAKNRFPDASFQKEDFIETRACYIIPYALGHYSDCRQKDRLSKLWASLFLFFPSLAGIMDPYQTNETRNIMTLWEIFSTQFGKLHMALEPTTDDHTYKIIVYPGIAGQVCKRSTCPGCKW